MRDSIAPAKYSQSILINLHILAIGFTNLYNRTKFRYVLSVVWVSDNQCVITGRSQLHLTKLQAALNLSGIDMEYLSCDPGSCVGIWCYGGVAGAFKLDGIVGDLQFVFGIGMTE